jgi:outer membrane protein assembly factor BamB
MTRAGKFVLWTLVIAAGLGTTAGLSLADSPDWPQFRGPDGQGQSSAKGLPLTWSEQENVAWKVPIPGLGWSSPVIQGNQIWLTTAVDDGRQLKALCLDRDTGKVTHDVTVFPMNVPVPLVPPNSHASPTAVIEGGYVYVHFGPYGTACLSTEGQILWKTKLPYRSLYGPSSTPVLCGELLLITCDGTDSRHLFAVDKKTGEVRWKQPRPGRNSESTPLLIRVRGVEQVISTSDNRVTAYEPRTGKALWSAKTEWGYALVPRPVLGDGLVYVCGGYFNPTLLAIRPDGTGDVTKTKVVWRSRRSVPNNPSPVLAGGQLYMVNDAGVASCLDAQTGKVHWAERLGGQFYASPLCAAGRIYFTNQDGVTTVLAAGTTFKKLATNKVAGRTLASLAVSGNALFLRSDQYLYRIDDKAAKPAAPRGEHVPAR